MKLAIQEACLKSGGCVIFALELRKPEIRIPLPFFLALQSLRLRGSSDAQLM